MKLDSDGYPTTCTVCGQPVVKSRGGSVHELTVATGQAQSWHLECRYPRRTHPTASVKSLRKRPHRRSRTVTETPTEPAPDPDPDNGDEDDE